jgi:hypothetical protein
MKLMVPPARSAFQRKQFENRIADALYGDATWSASEVKRALASLTLDPDTPLSSLAVETLPGGLRLPDPLGTQLGQERLLRTSPLVPVPAIC